MGPSAHCADNCFAGTDGQMSAALPGGLEQAQSLKLDRTYGVRLRFMGDPFSEMGISS